MKIDAVDFFYLAMPEIEEIGDGSQDVVLVRVRAGDRRRGRREVLSGQASVGKKGVYQKRTR